MFWGICASMGLADLFFWWMVSEKTKKFVSGDKDAWFSIFPCEFDRERRAFCAMTFVIENSRLWYFSEDLLKKSPVARIFQDRVNYKEVVATWNCINSKQDRLPSIVFFSLRFAVEMKFFCSVKLIPWSFLFAEKLLSLLVDFTTDSSVYLRALCLSALCSLLHNCQKVCLVFFFCTVFLSLKF